MKKTDDILQGMKNYFEQKQPDKNMTEVLRLNSTGNAKAARVKWESENPEEKTMAYLMSRGGHRV